MSGRLALASLLLALAVLLWPRRYPGVNVLRTGWPADRAPTPGEPGAEGVGRVADAPRVGRRLASAWRSLDVPWRRAAGRDAEIAAVLGVLDAVAPALNAGLAPVAALRLVDGPGAGRREGLLGVLVDAADAGEPLAPVWKHRAEASGSAELALVAGAWSLCETLGSPLAPTVTSVAQLLRQRRATRRRTEAAMAGPRATMRVLSGLPVAGPAIALVLGVPLAQLYATAPALLSVGCGVALLGLGRWWCQRLIGSMTQRSPPNGRPWWSRVRP